MRKLMITTTSILIILVAMSVQSCSKQDNIPDEVNTETETASVIFSFALPQGEPITVRAIHDEPEYTLNSLWMYEFNAEGTELISAKDIKAELTPGTPSEGYKYEKEVITTDGKATRRFVFIANDNPSGVTVGTTTLNDLNKKLATKVITATTGNEKEGEQLLNENAIPMSGVAMQGTSPIIAVTGTTAPIKVQLTRVVARIDVKNAVPNLVISKLHLISTNNKAYLMPQSTPNGWTYEAPADAEKVTLGTYAALPAPFDYGSLENKKELKKAFYLYEGLQPASEADAVHIIVTGKLGGQDVVYEIPFKSNDRMVDVKRNHLYRLTLGNDVPVEPGTDIEFTIEDTPWNEIIMNEAYEVIRIGCSSNSLNSEWDQNSLTLTVKKGFYFNYDDSNVAYFKIWTQYANHTKFIVEQAPETDWLRHKIENKSGVDHLFIEMSPLGSVEARTAKLVVSSDADPDNKYTITINQVKAE